MIELFFLLQCGKTAFLEMELFSLGKIRKTALSFPSHRPSIYMVTLKLIKGKIHYFVQEGKPLVKICPHPSVTKVVTVW